MGLGEVDATWKGWGYGGVEKAPAMKGDMGEVRAGMGAGCGG